MKHFLTRSLWVMNRGSTATMLKLKLNLYSGSQKHHQDQKKKDKFDAMGVQVDSSFFDRRIVYEELRPQGQIVNQHYYLDKMKRFCQKIRRKSPQLWSFFIKTMLQLV